MRLSVLLCVIILTGCSSTEDGPNLSFSSKKSAVEDGSDNVVASTLTATFEGAVDTIRSPFRDLGLIKEEIPEKLQEVVEDPYKEPEKMKCKNIMAELKELDEVLGADMYLAMNMVEDEDDNYLQRGSELVSSVAVSQISSKASILPFRGIVRKISGAESHANLVKRSYQAGQLRRAYLRGMASIKPLSCIKAVKVKAAPKEGTKTKVAPKKKPETPKTIDA